jgi:CheY-like chemotaxis protein
MPTMKILVVDDEKFWQKIIQKAVGQRADLVFVDDAQSAVNLLGQPDIVVNQILCDGLDGAWSQVYKAAGERGVALRLYTSNPDVLQYAQENQIPALDKGSSLQKFTETIFPTSNSIETEQ